LKHYPSRRPKRYFLAKGQSSLDKFSSRKDKKIKNAIEKEYLEKEKEQIAKEAHDYVQDALKNPKKLDKLLQDISEKGTQKVAEEVIAKQAIHREKLQDKIDDMEKMVNTAFQYEPKTDAENSVINELAGKWEVTLAILFKRTGSEILRPQVVPDQRAIARVIRTSKEIDGKRAVYTILQVHPSFFTLTDEQQKGVLIHEGIHLLHTKHDSQFRMLARAYHAPFGEQDIFKIPYTVSRKIGNGKREKIAEFPWSEDGPREANWYTKEEAAKIAQENKKNPPAAQKVRFYIEQDMKRYTEQHPNVDLSLFTG